MTPDVLRPFTRRHTDRDSSPDARVTLKDITGADHVEVLYGGSDRKVWVNLDGGCVFRVCQAEEIVVRSVDGPFPGDEEPGTTAKALIYQGYYPDKTPHQTLVALVLDGDDPEARKTAEAWWDNGEDLGEELDPEDYNADWHPWHEFEGTIDDKCVEGTYRAITADQARVRWGAWTLLKVAKMEERMENEDAC